MSAVALGAAAAASSFVVMTPAALAAGPPDAVDDSVTVAKVAAFDVLANDADPDVDPITVTGSSAPAHGSASCSALGACLYTATAGYVGADSFTYTVSDGTGGTDTATVALTVNAPTGGNHPPIANPDLITTQGTTPASVDVLANDTDPDGDSITASNASVPSHGVVNCASAGLCTYTADAGFSGIDSFSYTVSDPAQASRVGLVQVRVAPAGAGYAPTASGSPVSGTGSSITAGDEAAWTVGARPSPAGLPQELTAGLPMPTVDVGIPAGHTLVPGSATTAPGWAFDAANNRFVADPTALLGDSTIDAFPQPLAPISQGSGGDGHVPILVGSKVFAFFHHTYPTSVSCMDRATAALCPGYPIQLNVGASDIIGPAVVVGTRMWVHALPGGAFFASSYAQTAPISLFCWDAATDSTCGLITVDRVPADQANSSPFANPTATAPRLANGKIYFAGDTGRLYCVDPASNAACASPSIATGLAADQRSNMDIVTHGNKVFVSQDTTGIVACVDVVAGASCAGWATPVTFGGWNLINRHDATGATTGVCVVVSGALDCVDDATPGTIVPFTGWPSFEDYYTVTDEAETGTRTLFGIFGSSGLGCWDWTTNAGCTGNSYSNGVISQATDAGFLPSAYGASYDGSCVVALGDPGLVFTVDPEGSSPCTSLRSGAVRSVDLRAQRCDARTGGATWNSVEVTDTDLAAGVEFTSLTVTVRDVSTNQALLTQDMVGTSGVLDISSIDPVAHPALAVDANATSAAGNPAWVDGNAPKLLLTWNPDPAQGCFRTDTVAQCTAAPTSIAVSATMPTTAAGAGATLSVLGTTGCPNQAPVAVDTTVTTPPGQPVTVTLPATDPDGNPLVWSVLTQPAHGTLSAVNGNQVVYTPEAGYTGQDSFTFRANDGTDPSNTATVNLSITAPASTTTSAPSTTTTTGTLPTTGSDSTVSLALVGLALVLTGVGVAAVGRRRQRA